MACPQCRKTDPVDTDAVQRLGSNAEIWEVYHRLGLATQAQRDQFQAHHRSQNPKESRYVTRLAGSSEPWPAG